MLTVETDEVQSRIAQFLWKQVPDKTFTQVRSTRKKRGRIHRTGMLVEVLCKEFKREYTHETITAALNGMGALGIVELERVGDSYSSAKYTGDQPRGCRGIGPVEYAEQSDDTQAAPVFIGAPVHETPASLNDHTDQAESTAPESATEVIDHPQEVKKMSRRPAFAVTPEAMSLALLALQEITNDANLLVGTAPLTVIQDVLGCGRSPANRVNTLLGVMDLRRSKQTGHGGWEIMIHPGPIEITDDMLQAAIRIHGSKGQASEKFVEGRFVSVDAMPESEPETVLAEVESEPEAVEPEVVPTVSAEAETYQEPSLSVDDALIKMADIVMELREQVAEAARQNVTLSGEKAILAAEKEQLAALNDQLSDEVVRLEGELEKTSRVKLPSKVRDILDLYSR